MAQQMPSIDTWLAEAKADPSFRACGMYLIHNGTVRETPKAEARGVATDGVQPGHKVGGMTFSYDRSKVDAAIDATRVLPGIGYVRVWLNEGELEVGDDIMLVLVGGAPADEMAEAARTMGLSEDAIGRLATVDDAARVIGPVLSAGDLVLVKASRSAGLDTFVRGVLAR